MSNYIYLEASLAFHSFLLGLILMASYDLLRLFRLFIPHGTWWTGLEDFIYWMYCTIMTFCLLFYENDGILRGYVIACVFLAMFLYDVIVSRNVFALLKNIGKCITIKMRKYRRKEEMNHGTET